MERLWSHLEGFLFDPIEGLDSLEGYFLERRVAHPWLREVRVSMKKAGWLRLGLLHSDVADWQQAFFRSLLEMYDSIQQSGFQRDLLSKVAELYSFMKPSSWSFDLMRSFIERASTLPYEADQAYTLAAIARSTVGFGPQSWSQDFFRELVQHTRQLRADEEKGRLCCQIAGALAVQGEQAWVGRLFEEVVDIVRCFQHDTNRLETSIVLSEQFLGVEQVRPELAEAPFVLHAALLCVLIGMSDQESIRAGLARRLSFIEHQLSRRPDDVVTDTWERLLEALDALKGWSFEERDLRGDVRWKVDCIPSVIGVLGRSFVRSQNDIWVSNYFHQLFEMLLRQPPGASREQATHMLIEGLVQRYDTHLQETEGWMRLVLERAESVGTDASLVYDGAFVGFLTQGKLEDAQRMAARIVLREPRDAAFARLAEAWMSMRQPEESVLSVHEISDPERRGLAALSLCDEACLVQAPVACAMLLKEVSTLPGIAQQALQKIVAHPSLPQEAREAILSFDQSEEINRYAARERLFELNRLRQHLPKALYLKEKRMLLGLTTFPDEQESHEMSIEIMFDRPHRYGDGLYLTPREHINTNHFGEEVAGSRFTAWRDFDEMWEEIELSVRERLHDEGGVQVIELELTIDVGLVGVMEIDAVPYDKLAIEERNGQPSLYCHAPEVRLPSRWMTVVIGPSEVAEGALEDYEGHDVPRALYTIYPGPPADPFPRCGKEDHERLRTSLNAAVRLLQSEQVEEAKAVLFETYNKLEGHDDAARFWSRHVLIH